jgi:hypothetical protein
VLRIPTQAVSRQFVLPTDTGSDRSQLANIAMQGQGGSRRAVSRCGPPTVGTTTAQKSGLAMMPALRGFALGPRARGRESLHHPVASRRSYLLELAADAHGVSTAGRARLRSLFATPVPPWVCKGGYIKETPMLADRITIYGALVERVGLSCHRCHLAFALRPLTRDQAPLPNISPENRHFWKQLLPDTRSGKHLGSSQKPAPGAAPGIACTASRGPPMAFRLA